MTATHPDLPFKTTADRLTQPFPDAMLRHHDAKGLTYIPISEVIARLNSVLGIGGWGYTIIKTWEAGAQETTAGTYPRWIMAHVRLIATIDGLTTEVDGVGGQVVLLLKNGSDAVDLGDSAKGAVSDALKKAAQHLGVGLELARKEVALRAEAQANIVPASDEARQGLAERLKALDDPDAGAAAWKAAGLPKLERLGEHQLATAEALVRRLEDEAPF